MMPNIVLIKYWYLVFTVCHKLVIENNDITPIVVTSSQPVGGVTGFWGSMKISLCEDRRLKDTQNFKCEDKSTKLLSFKS